MTGGYRSRNQEDIIDEAKYLISQGVKEIQLIAQDLTYYGVDKSGVPAIADLTKRLSDLDGLEWIRLHYGYPNDFPMDLLQVMRERDNVCNYMDLALQHISNPVLERMHRNITAEQTRDLLAKIRQEVPGIHLRTTLMVGFPGETEDDYAQLVDFVKEMRFERMGAFAYSEVEGTYSARHFKDDVDEETKQLRLSKLMRIQQNIAADINQNKTGKVFKTIIDRIEGDYYVGRTEFDSPDVDPEMLIKADRELSIGNFYDVRVTDAMDFDLYGVVENN
jgi:ribosomal protein S12 methylthiotransferase